jgi:hypothetical protein
MRRDPIGAPELRRFLLCGPDAPAELVALG